jgi:signal peptidase I
MQMRRSKTSIAGIAAAACVALLWVFFGPPQLGGSTSYTATVGNSMEPLFHEGDLALTRPASSYRVGDIVLYMSPVFHRPVLHRILAIQHDHYFFKGDHNTFVDPGYATRHELLGKLWYRVPNAGKVVGWFGKPSHAAVMGAIAALVLLLGGSRQVRRRRRGRRRRTQDRRPPVLSTTIRRNLHGPRKSAENIFAMAAFAAAIVLLTVGFTTPLKKTVPLANAYTQSGTFSYTGKAIRRDAAYPTGTVEAPQPVFIANFKMLTVGFRYHFSSSLPHGVRGTIALKARLSSDAVTWHNSYVLVPPRPFSGDQASVSGTFELAQLGKLIQQLVTDSGVVSSEYGAEVIPIVHYTGVVRGHPVSGSYSPILALKISANVLTVESTSPAALPGATYTPESSGSSSLATLNPVQPGSIPAYAPTYAKLARYSLPTSLVRGIGLALIALALLVPFTKPLRHRRREVWSLEKRIAHHFDCVIVDVLSLDGIARTTGVATFTALATLARYSERPILHATIGDREEYAVEDGGALYVYRVEERGDEAEPMPTPRVTPTPTAARPRRRFRLALLSLVVLAVCATLVTALTAGNTVPPSYANASTHATQVSELAPGQCASLALTRLLVATTSSTTGTTASELLLGKNGSTTLSLNGGGGDDCLVGGGGVGTTNKFDGGPGTNICIGPAAATNTFSHCSQTYTS